MAGAALILLAVPLIVLASGALILVWAVRTLRRRRHGLAAGILQAIAGAGVLLCVPLSVLALASDMNYGVVIFPILWTFLAAAWAAVFLTAAALVEWMQRRRLGDRAAPR